MNIEELNSNIEAWSKDEGFLEYGAAPIKVLDAEIERLEFSISNSYIGSMEYLSRNIDLRRDPSLLMDGTKSIMCFLASYKPEFIQNEGVPKIAAYAYGEDYHIVIKNKLFRIVNKLREIIPEIQARVFVDSAPVMEREWARMAGLGFIGKNNFLINKKHGLHTLIGVILIDQTVKYNSKVVRNGCGSCTSCLDACPTGALMMPYNLDSRKCISYQTIESKKSHVSEEFVIDLKNHAFGCDICLNACPWSKKGAITDWNEFKPIDSLKHEKSILEFTQIDWLSITDEDFNDIFKNSPLKRAGINKIRDNLVVK